MQNIYSFLFCVNLFTNLLQFIQASQISGLTLVTKMRFRRKKSTQRAPVMRGFQREYLANESRTALTGTSNMLNCKINIFVRWEPYFMIVRGTVPRRLRMLWCHTSSRPRFSMKDSHASTVITGDPLHSRALPHSRALLFTQPCPHCSHSRAPGEQWARLCVFTLQGCVQAARLCRGSPVVIALA